MLQQAQLTRARHRFSASLDLQFAIDITIVPFHSAQREDQPLADLGGRLQVLPQLRMLFSRRHLPRVVCVPRGPLLHSDDHILQPVVELNDAGQVTGIALRYDGATEVGQTAWFYDDDLDQTFGMDFSVRASDGFAFSDTTYLGEDGLMLGYYTLFDDITSAT